MNVAFRVDASLELGLGHVMRSLTLADALRATGASVTFVTRGGDGSGVSLVERRGYDLIELAPVAYAHERLAAPLDEEIAASLDAFTAIGPLDLLIIDQYALGAEYERAMRTATRRIVAIDDLANRIHACDVLLDQNMSALDAHRYDGLLPHDCVRLFGPAYALLRPEFEAAGRAVRSERERVERIVISFGGFDARDVTSCAVRAVVRALGEDIGIDVLLSPAAPHAAAVAERCAALPNARMLPFDVNVASVMANADLGVGAGGTTVWERAYLGLPSIVLTVAENQRPSVARCAQVGMLRWIGDTADDDEERLTAAVSDIAHDRAGRRAMSERARAVMGAPERCGTALVVRALMETAACS